MGLPTKPQVRAGKPPQRARCIVAGMPKSGKTRLLANWAPDTTLIVDTHRGSELLSGEHYIAPVPNWSAFVDLVDELVRTQHPFQTVGLDLAEDLWRMCDKHYAPRKGDKLIAPLASAANDYQRSAKIAEAMFCEQIGRLLASEMGVWFITHVREKTEGDVTIYAPKLDPKIYAWVQGACDFVFLAESAGSKRLLHTQPGVQFEAGSRVPMPEPLPLDARELWLAMDRGLNPQDYDEAGNRKRPEPVLDPVTPSQEPVSASPEPQREDPAAGWGVDPDRTDVLAEDVWWAEIKAQLSAAKLSSREIADGVRKVGGVVPERVSSWERVITGLDEGQRAVFALWLQAKVEAKTGMPWAGDTASSDLVSAATAVRSVSDASHASQQEALAAPTASEQAAANELGMTLISDDFLGTGPPRRADPQS
jgi:hypothetical protein